MKFDVLDIIDGRAMEDGVWLHLVSPLDGELLYRDPETKLLPCRALVRSAQCSRINDWRSGHRRDIQAKLQKARAKERDELAQKAAEHEMAFGFHLQLVSLDNATSDKAGVVEVSEEDAAAWVNEPAMSWLVNQVLAFAQMPGNFGREDKRPTTGADGAGKPKAATRKTVA